MFVRKVLSLYERVGVDTVDLPIPSLAHVNYRDLMERIRYEEKC